MVQASDRRKIKLTLGSCEHDRVRLAAALGRTTMADFCRQVVLTEARRLTKGLRLAAEKRTDKTGTAKHSR